MPGIKIPSLPRSASAKVPSVKISIPKLPTAKHVGFTQPKEPMFEHAPQISGMELPRHIFRPLKTAPTSVAPHWSGR